MIDAKPELELVAASSGSTPIDGLAPLTQVGGDATELLERAEPDVVLNAIVGFAGIHATLWALERGVTLALANKESLVAAGELAATRGSGAAACCSRSTASTPRRSSCSRTAPGPGPRTRPHGVGRARSAAGRARSSRT